MAEQRAHMALPVFLPGNNRDWKEIQGIASISETGDIVIKLQNQKAAAELVDLARRNILLQVSFDYRLSPAENQAINDRYAKESHD